MHTKILIFILLLATYSTVSAQGTKKKKDKNPKAHQNSPQPYFPDLNFAPEKPKSGRSKGTTTYNAQKDFYKHREQVLKDKQKAEKEMMKPQYADPMYFGHKRPPKKRKPSKMKFCKECGIRH